MAKLDIQPLDIQPLDIKPLDIKPIEEETSLWEDIKIASAGAANKIDRWGTGLEIALSNLFGDTDYAEKAYKRSEEARNEREKTANPENKKQGFLGKFAGAGLTLPLQIAAFPFSPAETGQVMLENGETLGKAVGGTAIDTAGKGVV